VFDEHSLALDSGALLLDRRRRPAGVTDFVSSHGRRDLAPWRGWRHVKRADSSCN